MTFLRNESHGDETGLDIEPFMSRALDDVVDTIMLFGQYPAPRQKWISGKFVTANERILFSLSEWLADNYADELADMAVEFLSFRTFDSYECKTRHIEAVTSRIKEQLCGSNMVRDRAIELAEDEKQDREAA